MATNIKNPEVERLIDEIATLTGESKTEAVRRSLEERRQRLSYRIADGDRLARIQRLLENEVWPRVPAAQRGRTLSRAEHDELLGYGESGT